MVAKGLPLFDGLIGLRIKEVTALREEIRGAQMTFSPAIRSCAFFAHPKPAARDRALREVQQISGQPMLCGGRLRGLAAALKHGAHPVHPFHWELEFPEVFAGQAGGFDAIVGNPPFAGKNTLLGSHREGYLDWLQTLHEGAHGNSDLAAHFFRRAFALLRRGGCFGLIATNTVGQGDTRESGLRWLLEGGGNILRAVRRTKWPGEAAVVVSIVHVPKGRAVSPVLGCQQVRRISAYLVEGDLDASPAPLAANAGKAFQGCTIVGLGFTFDDEAAAKTSTIFRRDGRRWQSLGQPWISVSALSVVAQA